MFIKKYSYNVLWHFKQYNFNFFLIIFSKII